MEDELKRNLRELISKSSSAQVYKALADIFNEEYSFLHKFFVGAKESKKIKKADVSIEANSDVSATAPTPVNTEDHPAPSANAKAERMRGDAKVIVMKKPADPDDLLDTQAQAQPLPDADADQQCQATVHTQSGFREAKDIKKWQKEQEEKKAVELRAAGVNPVSLLTEANIRKWVVDEKKTFAAIARDYVGLSELVISTEAKKYGLQSETTKRRMMIAKAKGKGL